MRIDPGTIQQAFQQHDAAYVQGRRWTIEDSARLWDLGQRALAGTGDADAFGELHGTLRRYWQVFRGPQPIARDPAHAFGLIRSIDQCYPALRQLRLSELSSQHLPDLDMLLDSVSEIKKNNRGRPWSRSPSSSTSSTRACS